LRSVDGTRRYYRRVSQTLAFFGSLLSRSSSGSVGQLFPNTKARLLDDAGNEVLDGQPGELYVRGPNICLGYWRNPHATKDTFTSDGWLKTGDVAVVRNGWFWIVDRKKVSSSPTSIRIERELKEE